MAMPAESGHGEIGGAHRAQLQAGKHAEVDRCIHGKADRGILGTDGDTKHVVHCSETLWNG